MLERKLQTALYTDPQKLQESQKSQVVPKLPELQLPIRQKCPLHLQQMLLCKEVVETPTGSNRSPLIDNWRKQFGINVPVPWCAIFSSVKAKEGKVESPLVWSCQAKSFAVKGHSWKLTDIIFNRYIPKPGDYRVKTRRGGNHVDVFISWDKEKQEGYVIGGNVGDRVMVRKMTIKRMIADGTTHITEVKGNHDYIP